MRTKPRVWTPLGLQKLGKLIKSTREQMGYSLRDLENYIEEQTGHRVSNTSISGLERANRTLPQYNTLAILAAAEFLIKPDGTPYSIGELSAIAAEEIDPTEETESMSGLIIPFDSFKGNDVYTFSPSKQERLRLLLLATRERLLLSEDAFIERAIANTDLSFEEMRLLCKDIEDGTIRTHTRKRVEALARILFKGQWRANGWQLGSTTYQSLAELERDLQNGNSLTR